MKKEKFVKKLKSAARKALVFTLCIACILSIVPNESYAGASYQGYLWYRIKNQDDFHKFAHGGLKSSDGSMKTGEEYVANNVAGKNSKDFTAPEDLSMGKTSDWYRVLMVYGGNNQRFISGNTSCNSNKSFMGQYANASYGIDMNADTFITTSGLNTPYIKYNGWDGDNKCGRYYVRFSENDQLGSTYWNMYTKWYGAAYHAAAKCEFDRPGRDIKDWKDNENYWSYQSFQWKNNGVIVRYNIANTTDRGWEWWSDGEIRCTKDFDETPFKLFLGVQYPVSEISTTFKITEGTTVSWNYYTIAEGASVVVGKGATLIIDGTCYNNGAITVEEGGSVIIRGVLDMSPPKNGSSYPAAAGRMEFGKNSLLLVEDTGILITRNPAKASQYSFDHCTVDIQGTAVFTQAFVLNGTDFRVGYGAAACVGVVPNSDQGVSTYNRKWIHANKGTYLSTLCKTNPDNSKVDARQNLEMLYGSSLQSNGIFFLSPELGIYTQGWSYDYIFEVDEEHKSYYTDSYISINRSSNINAPLEKMMLKW